jgi:hypothetical protein
VGDSRERFLELKFDGGRFANHSIPVDVLAELGTVQQLIVRVARHLFFQQHTDRRRVPGGFVEAAQLHLVASEASCFTAELARSTERGTWPSASSHDRDLFEAARDLSIMALDCASSGEPLPREFPSDALDLLASLGRRLDDDEKLFVRGNPTGTVARVDQSTRMRIAQLAQRPLVREEILDGEVERLDDAADRFWLRPRGGERVEVPFESHQRAALLEALSMRPIVRVRVRGQLVLAVQAKMKAVEDMEFVDDERAGEVQRLWTRIASLEKVGDGWLEGEGRAPSPLALARAREVLARLLVTYPSLERPKVFPTPDGGVQAEWVRGRWAAEALFDVEEGGISAEATHGDSGEERALVFARNEVTAEDASRLATWLESLD